MRKYLLTFGLALVLVIALSVTGGGSYAVGERIGRLSVPLVLAALGFFWRRHPIIGYWLVFIFLLVAMTLGSNA